MKGMKFILSLVSILIGGSIAIGLTNKETKEPISDLVKKNIEALALNEGGPQPGDRLSCYNEISSSGLGVEYTSVAYCGTCGPIYCKTYSNSGKCYVH